MRAQTEIVERIDGIGEGRDFFSVRIAILVKLLDFDHAQKFLKDEVTRGDWPEPSAQDEILSEMHDYFGFALSKVEDHRGLSSGRSIDRMKEWCWLLGKDEIVAFIEVPINYKNYGAPILKRIADEMGWEFPADEMMLRMSQGKQCVDGCEMGCAV